MNVKKIVFALLILTFAFGGWGMAKTEEDQDFAVPAFSDLPILATQNPAIQRLAPSVVEEPLNPLPTVERLRWFDLNRDFQLNEFDVNQFKAIIESLRGEGLTGLELTIRFRGEQKNQKESFLLLYDVDRDGMFTPYDVDYFTEIITRLDQGATRGNELIEKFRVEVFPQTANQ